ncbi:MAG: YjfB family protein [Lachnospiraceae bacterium]
MDIAALSVDMHMIDLQSKVSTALLSKSLDTLETTGESMIKMMEASVMPNLGQNIDVSV